MKLPQSGSFFYNLKRAAGGGSLQIRIALRPAHFHLSTAGENTLSPRRVFFRSAEPPDKRDLKFILRLWAQSSARLCAVQTLEAERKF